MKDRLIELMKTNLDLVESSIHLYIENQKLRSQVARLQERKRPVFDPSYSQSKLIMRASQTD